MQLYDVIQNEATKIPAYIFPYVHGIDYRVRDSCVAAR